MTFGEALEALNNGAFVARKGWNGKGMFVYKVEASEATYDKLRGRCKDAIDYVYKHVKDDEPQTVQETIHINAHIDNFFHFVVRDEHIDRNEQNAKHSERHRHSEDNRSETVMFTAIDVTIVENVVE